MTESVTDPANGPSPSDPQSTAITSADQLAAVRETRGLGKGEVAQRKGGRACGRVVAGRGQGDDGVGRGGAAASGGSRG